MPQVLKIVERMRQLLPGCALEPFGLSAFSCTIFRLRMPKHRYAS